MNVKRMVTMMSAAGLTAVLLTGCGLFNGDDPEQAPDDPSMSEGGEQPGLTLGEDTFTETGAANRQEADSTAQVATEVIFSWDTALDSDRLVALHRAEPLLEEEWARQSGGAVEQIPIAGWSEAYDHEGYAETTVETVPNDVARDYGPDRATREFKVSWEWVGRDGERVPGGETRVTVYLERDDTEQWSVVGHHDSAELSENPAEAVTGQDVEPAPRGQEEAPEHDH